MSALSPPLGQAQSHRGLFRLERILNFTSSVYRRGNGSLDRASDLSKSEKWGWNSGVGLSPGALPVFFLIKSHFFLLALFHHPLSSPLVFLLSFLIPLSPPILFLLLFLTFPLFPLPSPLLSNLYLDWSLLKFQPSALREEELSKLDKEPLALFLSLHICLNKNPLLRWVLRELAFDIFR